MNLNKNVSLRENADTTRQESAPAAGLYLNQFYAMHVNALGSSTANTDSTGSEVGYKLFYPWGQRWLTQGTGGYEFSSFDFENPPSDLGPTLFRTYIPGYGRWMTPTRWAVTLPIPSPSTAMPMCSIIPRR